VTTARDRLEAIKTLGASDGVLSELAQHLVELEEATAQMAYALDRALDLAEIIESDVLHHETYEDTDASVRAPDGWRNVDEYAYQLRTLIDTALHTGDTE